MGLVSRSVTVVISLPFLMPTQYLPASMLVEMRRFNQGLMGVVLLPTWAPAVRAGAADGATPSHSAQGGDLAAAVEAPAGVVVVVVQVLVDEIEAVRTAADLGGVV